MALRDSQNGRKSDIWNGSVESWDIMDAGAGGITVFDLFLTIYGFT